MAEHKQVISVSVDDSQARRALDELVKRLERANQMAGNLGVGGGQGQPLAGAAPSTTAGTGESARAAAPRAGSATGSTAGGGQRPPEGMEKAVQMARSGTAMASATASAAIGYTQGVSQDPAWAIRTVGRMVKDISAAAAHGVTAIAEAIPEAAQAIPKVAAVAMVSVVGAQASKIAGQAMAAGLEFIAEGVGVRYTNLQRIASMERPIETIRNVGGIDAGLGSKAMMQGIGFGFGPEESVQMWQSYLSGIGIAGSGKIAPSPFQSAVSGINPGMLARYQALGGAGGGAQGGHAATVQSLPGAIGLAMQFGMSGPKIDEFLARIATSTTMMAEQGLSLDLASVNRLTADLESTGSAAAARSGGRNVFSGMNAVRTSLALNQMGPQASRGFLGQFSGLRDMALFSYAAQQTGGDYFAAVEYMQGMGGEETQAAISQMLPGQAAIGAFSSGGNISVGQGRLLAGGLSRGNVSRSLGGASAGAMPLSRQIAGQEHDLLLRAKGMGGSEEIIAAVFEVQRVLLELSRVGVPVIAVANKSMKKMAKASELFITLHGG